VLRLSHPYGHATCRLCGICKAQTVQSFASDGRRSVFVGDGSTDKFAAEVADIVFARRRLKGYCEASGIPHYPFEEFGPVTHQLRRWLDREEPLPPPRTLGLVDSPCPISRASFAAA
jgi:2-hydroxy-3-keto-5-methylthiopentenyl-1-phosphate phosphatase